VSGFRRYAVHPEALAQAQKLGLFGNVEKRLARMARLSAPFTHQAGNRRFESYVLRVQDGQVVSIKKLDLVSGGVITDVMGKLGRQQRTIDAIERHLGPDQANLAQGGLNPDDVPSTPTKPGTTGMRQARGRRQRHE